MIVTTKNIVPKKKKTIIKEQKSNQPTLKSNILLLVSVCSQV